MKSKIKLGTHYTARELRRLGLYNVKTGDPAKDGAISKYKNKRTYVDGIHFASQREGRRYSELKLLAKHGMIDELRLQVPYEFMVNGKLLRNPSGRSYRYIADFVYIQDGATVVEDVKGVKTREYKTKKMLMDHVNHISIFET